MICVTSYTCICTSSEMDAEIRLIKEGISSPLVKINNTPRRLQQTQRLYDDVIGARSSKKKLYFNGRPQLRFIHNKRVLHVVYIQHM